MFYTTVQNYIDQVVIPALGELYKEYDLQAIAAECTAWAIKKSELVEIATNNEFWRVVEENWLPSKAYVAEFLDAETNAKDLEWEAGKYFLNVIDSEEAEEYESPFLVLSHPYDEELAFVYRSDMA